MHSTHINIVGLLLLSFSLSSMNEPNILEVRKEWEHFQESCYSALENHHKQKVKEALEWMEENNAVDKGYYLYWPVWVPDAPELLYSSLGELRTKIAYTQVEKRLTIINQFCDIFEIEWIKESNVDSKY